MITLNDRQIVFSETFLIPKDETLNIQLSNDQIKIKLVIQFTTNLQEPRDSSVSWETAEDGIRMTFVNWDNRLGTSLIHPALLTYGRENIPIGFLASNHKIGDMNILHLQLMTGGTYGKE